MDNSTNQVQLASHREYEDRATELRSLARGTPIRIRMPIGSKVVTFLEMKRTRFIFEDAEGEWYAAHAGAFIEIAQGDIPKRFRNPRATQLLHQACEENSLSEIRRLISEGADIDARSHESHGARVPLEDAIQYGQIEAIKLLLEQGAKVNVCDRRGRTPLRLAAIMGNEGIVQELLDKGADMNARDRYGTALDWAARFRRTDVVRLLETYKNRNT